MLWSPLGKTKNDQCFENCVWEREQYVNWSSPQNSHNPAGRDSHQGCWRFRFKVMLWRTQIRDINLGLPHPKQIYSPPCHVLFWVGVLPLISHLFSPHSDLAKNSSSTAGTFLSKTYIKSGQIPWKVCFDKAAFLIAATTKKTCWQKKSWPDIDWFSWRVLFIWSDGSL